MLDYDFPLIYNITDVLPHIEGCKSIVKVDKGDYTVLDYVVIEDDTFPDPKTLTGAMRRECRGLIFSNFDGRLIRRAFHKFHNMGECPETQHQFINYEEIEHISDKLDGSMVAPFLLNGKVIFATMMGETDIAYDAQVWATRNFHYLEMCYYLLQFGFQPIFEWVGHNNRVVVEYEEPQLTLLAIRNMHNGKYDSRQTLEHEAERYGVKLAGTIPIPDSLEDLRDLEGIEGYVITFKNGHKVKLKTDWYTLLHRSKSDCMDEKSVARMVFTNVLDDVLPLLSESDYRIVIEYKRDLLLHIRKYVEDYAVSFYYISRAKDYDRKNIMDVMLPSLIDKPLLRSLDLAKQLDRTSFVEHILKIAIPLFDHRYCYRNKKYQEFKKEIGFDKEYNIWVSETERVG